MKHWEYDYKIIEAKQIIHTFLYLHWASVCTFSILKTINNEIQKIKK